MRERRVEVKFQPPARMLEIPPSVERYFASRGLVVTLDNATSTTVARRHIKGRRVLNADELQKDDGVKMIHKDLLGSGFTVDPQSGAYRLGDVVIYVHSRAQRDALRAEMVAQIELADRSVPLSGGGSMEQLKEAAEQAGLKINWDEKRISEHAVGGKEGFARLFGAKGG